MVGVVFCPQCVVVYSFGCDGGGGGACYTICVLCMCYGKCVVVVVMIILLNSYRSCFVVFLVLLDMSCICRFVFVVL